MSRYQIQGTRGSEKVTVVLGFDPPLQHYFVDVTKGKATRPFYTSMAEPAGGFGSLEALRRKLSELGVQVPDETFRMIAATSS